MLFTAFSVFLSLTIANNTTLPNCQGCLVRGRQGGAWIWARPEEFLNETIYIEVDTEKNETQTLSRLPNTDAESSYWSLCTSALRSLQGVYATIPFTGTGWVYTPNCASGGTVSSTWEDYTDGTDGIRTYSTISKTWSWPTSVFVLTDIIVETSIPVVSARTTTCSMSATTISFHQAFLVPPEDHAWFTTSFNGLHSLTSNGQIPFSAYPSFTNCSRGTAPGIPVTKIPIHGITSTVINYKSKIRPTESSVPRLGPQPSSATPQITAELPRISQSPNNPQTLNIPQAPNHSQGSNIRQPGVTVHSDEPRITSPPQAFNAVPGVNGIALPNGATLPFGSQTTISGTVYSLSPNTEDPSIIIGSSIFALQKPPILPEYSVLSDGEGIRLPNGETLQPGALTTLDGVPVSVASDGAHLILEAGTISLEGPSSSGNMGGLNGNSLTNGVGISGPRMISQMWMMIIAAFSISTCI